MQTTTRYEIRGDVRETPEKTAFYPFTVKMQDNASLASAVAVAGILGSRPDLVGNMHLWEFVDQLEQKGRRCAVKPCRACGGLCTDMNLPECQKESPDPARVPQEPVRELFSTPNPGSEGGIATAKATSKRRPAKKAKK